jgi:hypothetical protein
VFGSVLENVIANLLTGAIVGSVAYLLLYIRMSGVMQRLRRLLHPMKRVFITEGQISGTINKDQVSSFRSPLSIIERDRVVAFYATRNGSNPHNGTCVRLDKIEKISNQQSAISNQRFSGRLL